MDRGPQAMSSARGRPCPEGLDGAVKDDGQRGGGSAVAGAVQDGAEPGEGGTGTLTEEPAPPPAVPPPTPEADEPVAAAPGFGLLATVGRHRAFAVVLG